MDKGGEYWATVDLFQCRTIGFKPNPRPAAWINGVGTAHGAVGVRVFGVYYEVWVR